ncbi:MAG TPA: hypothetical protein VK828_06865 [Terriglobales bacterium]|jgi:hypothetical protein|nr:hypothetical protein [Terriglobales bacterium]
MSKSRCFQVITLFAIVAFAVCSQMAYARPRAAVAQHSQALPATYPAPGLYGVTQAFAGSPYNPNQPGNGWTNNTDGVELWPCFGDGGGNGNCPSIGNPAIGFGGIAIGDPFFTWSLAACDGTTNGTQNPYTWDQGATWNPYAINGFYVPCGQITTFYQDYANDNTDEILWRAQVTQGLNVIADTGTQDWGPNPYGGGELIVFYQDFNFGALGDTGPNNGNCVPNYNYPDTIPPALSYPVITAGGHTCVDPVAGPATLSVVTSLATPTWTCKDERSVVTCKVKYVTVHSLKQEWKIYLQ